MADTQGMKGRMYPVPERILNSPIYQRFLTSRSLGESQLIVTIQKDVAILQHEMVWRLASNYDPKREYKGNNERLAAVVQWQIVKYKSSSWHFPPPRAVSQKASPNMKQLC